MRYVKRERLPFVTFHQRDVCLADYLCDLCYAHNLPPSKGSLAFYSFTHIFPEHKGYLPEASRALQAWGKLDMGGEGGPLSASTIGAIALGMICFGCLLESLALLLSEDCYLREQDWSLLRKEDVASDGSRVSITMGVRARGEKIKTGSNQGVIIDSEVVASLLWAVCCTLRSGDLVFPFPPIHYRKLWWQVLDRLGLRFCGPPHNVRHSKPAADISKGTRTLEEVRRRGRWAALSSVQRYIKDFLLIQHESKVPEPVRSQGQALMKDPVKVLTHAVLESHAAGGGVVQVFLRALDLCGRSLGSSEACNSCGARLSLCSCASRSVSFFSAPPPPAGKARNRKRHQKHAN